MSITIGNILGKLTKTSVNGAGYITKSIGAVAEKIAKDEKTKDLIHKKAETISKKIEDNSDPIANKISNSVTKAILTSEKFGGRLSKNIACKITKSPEKIEQAEQIGKFVTKAAVSGATAIACVAAAGTATATVGASVTTHGLAVLGLGSMKIGLVTVSAIAGSVYSTKEQDKKIQETDIKPIDGNNNEK